MPVLGFLSGRSLADSSAELREFHRGLAEAGFIEGKNVAIQFRWADGRYDRLPALASELIGQRVAVIAAVGGGLRVWQRKRRPRPFRSSLRPVATQ